MPIYEYICEDCQTHFEKIVLNKQQEISCPKCASKRNAIQLSVFSAGNGPANGALAKSSSGFSGGGGGCWRGGCFLPLPPASLPPFVRGEGCPQVFFRFGSWPRERPARSACR